MSENPVPLGRKMTPSEIEDNRVAHIEAGAVGQNAVVCECGRIIEHFPNTEGFKDNLFTQQDCDWCKPGEVEPGVSPQIGMFISIATLFSRPFRFPGS
jgi:hypothetical protein